MDNVEIVSFEGKILAYIIRSEINLDKTTFITPKESNLQVGFVVYSGGKEIPRHIHKPIKRNLDRTEEVLFIKKGRCEIDIYDEKKHLVAKKTLKRGDIIVLVGGGHGFNVFDDTVLMEIKQGPYTGLEEKERF